MNCLQRKFMFAFEIGKKSQLLPLNPLRQEVRGRIPRKDGGIKVKTFSSRYNYSQPINPIWQLAPRQVEKMIAEGVSSPV
jgi:hypothetical protein